MAGRGPQSFKKRQREQARKEKQDEKRSKRLERNALGPTPEEVLEKNPILEELEAMDEAGGEPIKSLRDLVQ